MKLQEQEDDYTQIQQKFSSLAEELDFKSKRLDKLWEKYQDAST